MGLFSTAWPFTIRLYHALTLFNSDGRNIKLQKLWLEAHTHSHTITHRGKVHSTQNFSSEQLLGQCTGKKAKNGLYRCKSLAIFCSQHKATLIFLFSATFTSESRIIPVFLQATIERTQGGDNTFFHRMQKQTNNNCKRQISSIDRPVQTWKFGYCCISLIFSTLPLVACSARLKVSSSPLPLHFKRFVHLCTHMPFVMSCHLFRAYGRAKKRKQTWWLTKFNVHNFVQLFATEFH